LYGSYGYDYLAQITAGTIMSLDDRQEDLRALKVLAPLVRDLHKPNPLIYWTDLAICLALIVFGLYLSNPFPQKILAGSVPAILGLLVAGLALYRASYFNHELAHQSRQLPGFELGWNLFIGIPLLIPSFLYSDHLNHHSIRGFGTDSDIEYFSPELRGFRGALLLLAVCAVLPLLYVGRFTFLPPAAWVNPRIRRWVDTHASGLGILGLSRRVPPTAAELFSWRAQEAACFGYLLLMGVALVAGLLPVSSLLQFYTTMGILLFFHAIRIMVGHRYESDGEPQDRVEQVLDSFNFTRNRVTTSILAPLGFRLHALHHLFPKIPYHNMPEAHRRISEALPKDSFYHAASSPSYLREVARFLFRNDKGKIARAAHAPASGDKLVSASLDHG
jgi:fatty acid desaturase